MNELNNEGRPQESGAPSTLPNNAAPQSTQAFEQAGFATQSTAMPRMSMPSVPYSGPREVLPETLRPGRHHVHHTYIWLGSIRAVLSTIFAIAVVAFSTLAGAMAESDTLDAQLLSAVIPLLLVGFIVVAVLIAGVAVLFQWLSWKHLTYELGSDEFSLYSGIFNKKRMHIPYQRVQAVNQQAGLFHRLVGVCDIKIDTAGGAANDSVRLNYMRTAEAEALRSELFRRKKVLLVGGSIAEDGTATVGGITYYSAGAVAAMGGSPQAMPLAAFGYVLQPLPNTSPGAGVTTAPPMIEASFAPYGASVSDKTNVLDMPDEVMQDVRGVFGGTEANIGRVSFETGLSNKELLLAGASGAGEGLGLLLVGVVAAVASLTQLFQGNIERWVDEFAVTAIEDGRGAWMSDSVGLSSLVGVVAFQIILWALLAIAVLWFISALATVVRYGGFRLRRREGRVEVEAGLLSRSFHGVDVDRVQSVLIKQSPIRRLMGYCEVLLLKIDSGTPQSNNAQTQQLASRGVVIHPFVKVSNVSQIIGGVLPEFADLPEEVCKPAPIALRRAIVRKSIIQSSLFWLAVFVVLAQIVMEAAIQSAPLDDEVLVVFSVLRTAMFSYYGLFALAFIINVVNAVLWHRRSGLGYNRGFVSITNGGLGVTTTYMPRKKIQYAFLSTNPLQRKARVASVNVRTAAGVGGTTETLWDLSEEDAAAWMEWVRPRERHV